MLAGEHARWQRQEQRPTWFEPIANEPLALGPGGEQGKATAVRGHHMRPREARGLLFSRVIAVWREVAFEAKRSGSQVNQVLAERARSRADLPGDPRAIK